MSDSLSGDFQSFLATDFGTWLSDQGYDPSLAAIDYNRSDLSGGSFGGKNCQEEVVGKTPIVFVHGNSDRATGGPLGGFQASRSAFAASGYASSELYATTWGPADALQATQQHHSQAALRQTRGFLLAVAAYSGANQVDVVAHSLGVTLARQAIRGGNIVDENGQRYQLGPSIAPRIATLVGIAGANLGLVGCYPEAVTSPTCNKNTGFYPGDLVGNAVVGRATLLEELSVVQPEASHVVSVWSEGDTTIGSSDLVWGQYTSQIAGQDEEVRRDELDHLALRDATDIQLTLLAP